MKKETRLLFLAIAISFFLCFVIVLIDPYVSDQVLLADSGASHYYWKLPTRNNMVMLLVWSLFFIHLFGNYFLIRKRQKNAARGFVKENYYLAIFNLVMIILHYVESIVYYDGLAQDVSIFSSQYSVILVLVTIILMQVSSRGIIFGIKLPLPPKVLKYMYMIHGFVFTFAIVYTFWYHPVINTIGHLFGFFYMFLLFTQICFFKTSVHTNTKWIVLLEVLVAFHGASVAYYVQNSDLWSMFFYGFGFLFAFTQVYGLTKNRVITTIVQIVFSALAIYYYASTDISNIHQVLWIPIIEYLHVVVLYLIFIGIYYFTQRNTHKNQSN